MNKLYSEMIRVRALKKRTQAAMAVWARSGENVTEHIAALKEHGERILELRSLITKAEMESDEADASAGGGGTRRRRHSKKHRTRRPH